MNQNRFCFVAECLKVLKSQPRDADRVPQGANQVALVWKILNTCAEKGDVDGVRELFNTLKERGLTPVNNVVLGPLVKAHLVKYAQFHSSLISPFFCFVFN